MLQSNSSVSIFKKLICFGYIKKLDDMQILIRYKVKKQTNLQNKVTIIKTTIR